MTKPTILFVHGAWHQPAHFKPIMSKLEALGYPCFCPQQPTFNVPAAEMRQFPMYADAQCIRASLSQLIEEEHRDVLVVMHSYGSVVGTEAVHADYGIKHRQAAGKKGGVLRIMYMAGFLLPPNTSLGSAFGGDLPPFITKEEDGSCNMNNRRVRFYEQLSDAEAEKWLALTRPHPTCAQLTPLTYTAYKHHPVSYLVATRDPALAPEAQFGMIKAVKALGVEVDVHEVPSDHSPYLSKEKETIAVIEKLATASAA